jgi:hypothetical protein
MKVTFGGVSALEPTTDHHGKAVDFDGVMRKKCREKNGASEGIRTLDTHVGNVMLYQAELRSLP